MKIMHFPLGPIGTNCYILHDPEEEECILIDPGDEPDRVIRQLDKLGVTPKYILITHGHPDHFGGVAVIKHTFPQAQVMIHEADHGRLAMPGVGKPVADAFLRDGDEIVCGSMRLKVIHTPGHSPGGVSLYAEDEACVFVGDTLFRASIGRTDFPGGDYDTLESSILNKLYKLPPETIVYSGHSSYTRIEDEMLYNPFIPADINDPDK